MVKSLADRLRAAWDTIREASIEIKGEALRRNTKHGAKFSLLKFTDYGVVTHGDTSVDARPRGATPGPPEHQRVSVPRQAHPLRPAMY